MHDALYNGAPAEVVRALLDAYPHGAGRTTNDGHLPLHFAVATGAPLDVVRMLVDASPGAANIPNNGGHTPGELSNSNNHPKVYVMLALARAHLPPNQPWTTRTHSILRQIAAEVPNSGASALIDAHVSRVRALLCTLRRLGKLPAALVPSIVGKVYVSDFFE